MEGYLSLGRSQPRSPRTPETGQWITMLKLTGSPARSGLVDPVSTQDRTGVSR
jgi:hypothetical protein